MARHRAVAAVLKCDHPFLPEPTASGQLGEDALKHRQDEAHLDILSRFIEECQQADEPLFKSCETLRILGAFLPGHQSSGTSHIHATHQLAFAGAIQDLVAKITRNQFAAYDWHEELMKAIPGLSLFAAYTQEPYSGYGSRADTIWTAPSQGRPRPSYASYPGYSVEPVVDPVPAYIPTAASSWSNIHPDEPAAQWLTSADARWIMKAAFQRYMAKLQQQGGSNYTLMIHIQGIINNLTVGLPPIPEHRSDLDDSQVLQLEEDQQDERTTSDSETSSNSSYSSLNMWQYVYPPGPAPVPYVPIYCSPYQVWPRPINVSDLPTSPSMNASTSANNTLVPPSRPPSSADSPDLAIAEYDLFLSPSNDNP
ncbi:hypothetical protein K438DRAFT_1860201 [Mycena galopus ATCC 62051]|nr:hypothetical protein K438DRAFT_1860201 [Mycena galopus ATCC 62051]